jgi:preprotein translocase subunit SecB
MNHSFKIIGIRLSEAHFALNDEYKKEKNKPIEITSTIEIGYKLKNEVAQVHVSVSADSEDQPFRFSVAWEGSFDFKEIPLKDDLDRIAHINCASIIFPYVRETIADLTRRASIPPFNMPPFNFVALYEESKKATPQLPRKTRKKSKA